MPKEILVRMKAKTYVTYCGVWKRLLCFIIRTYPNYQQHQAPEFRAYERAMTPHQYSPSVAILIDFILEEAVVNRDVSNNHNADFADGPTETINIDRYVMALCLELFKVELRGDIHTSPIIAFLAILGIDQGTLTLMPAPKFTGKLSAIIKMTQLLLIQQCLDREAANEVSNISFLY